MAVQERVEWRPGRRNRPVRWLVWYVLGAGILVAIVWLLFGSEPATLESGQSNSLARLPLTFAIGALVGAIPFIAAIFRRPTLGADHYALTIRPGAVRTLVLPWALLAEVAVYRIRDEQFLLLRCITARGVKGDRPHWYDRAALRAAARANRMRGGGRKVVAAYDLAARGSDFRGDARRVLADLSGFAPPHVLMVNEPS